MASSGTVTDILFFVQFKIKVLRIYYYIFRTLSVPIFGIHQIILTQRFTMIYENILRMTSFSFTYRWTFSKDTTMNIAYDLNFVWFGYVSMDTEHNLR